MSQPKPRKFRRIIMVGHRSRERKEALGWRRDVPDAPLKRFFKVQHRRGSAWNPIPGRGRRPAQKPKDKK